MESFCLKEDIVKVDWIKLKCKTSRVYAQNLYAALCNNKFYKHDLEWSTSWRNAGEIVSTIVETGTYLDWYCTGMVGEKGFVEEGHVTTEVGNDILNLGWAVAFNQGISYD